MKDETGSTETFKKECNETFKFPAHNELTGEEPHRDGTQSERDESEVAQCVELLDVSGSYQ